MQSEIIPWSRLGDFPIATHIQGSFHNFCSSISFDSPYQFPQIPALYPSIPRSTACAQPTAASTASANTPALSDFPNHARGPPSYHGAGWYHHVSRYDGVGKDLHVFFDDSEGLDHDIGANVDMGGDGDCRDGSART